MSLLYDFSQIEQQNSNILPLQNSIMVLLMWALPSELKIMHKNKILVYIEASNY